MQLQSEIEGDTTSAQEETEDELALRVAPILTTANTVIQRTVVSTRRFDPTVHTEGRFVRIAPISRTANTASQHAVVSRLHSAPTAHTLPKPSVFKRMAAFIRNFFKSQPSIIEYSNTEIAQRTSIRIRARRIQSNSLAGANRMLRMTMEVKNENGPIEPVELVARHKRVKDIMIKAGVKYVSEEVYKEKISKAIRKLKEAEERVRAAATTNGL